MPYKEHELVVLRSDVPAHGLCAGDIGTVVGVYDGGAYEVEFATPGGDTVAVLTLAPKEIRPLARREILHARDLDRLAS